MGSQNTVEGQVRRRLETFLQKSDIAASRFVPVRISSKMWASQAYKDLSSY